MVWFKVYSLTEGFWKLWGNKPLEPREGEPTQPNKAY